MTDKEKIVLLEMKCSGMERELMIRRNAEAQIRSIRHDIKNHLAVMAYLNKKGASQRLADYIKDLDTDLSVQVRCQYTGNELIDIILTNRSADSDMKIEPYSLTLTPAADDYSLCVVISNVIDKVLSYSRKPTVSFSEGMGMIMMLFSWEGPSAVESNILDRYAVHAAKKCGIIVGTDAIADNDMGTMSILIPTRS